MKTIIIFDQLGDAMLQFIVLDGDYSRFSGVCINRQYKSTIATRFELQEELYELLYDKNGKMKFTLLEEFPIDVVKRDKVKVIVCEFMSN